jgi:uncharacterized protein
MLVRFAVQNYLSFNERTEFNMLTGSPRRLPHHVYHRNDLELLKMAAVYGANGAGKSNFVKAIIDLKGLVENGKTVLNYMRLKKFLLNSSNISQPVSFEVEFIVEEKMFLYMISCDNHIILSEKLSLTKLNKTDELIFERLYVDDKIKINFNEKYQKTEQDKLRIKIYEEELLKNDETLLSMLNESREGFYEIKQAFSWFNRLNSISPNDSVSNTILIFPEIFDFVKEYITQFNTGINDIEIVNYTFDQYFGSNNQQIKDSLKEELKTENIVELNQHLKQSSKNKAIATIEGGEYVIKSLRTFHLNEKKEKVAFTPVQESDGSVRIWDLLTLLFNVIHIPCVMIIDEIESSIHPYLLKELITKFSEHKETKGQLIFTTHESNLLDQEIFRQDEIWFAEKNTEGATEMYPMSDFDVRYDLDVRKGYLNGRFGAIPFLSDFKNLNWKANA